MTDEVPAKGVAVDGMLLLEILGTVLPHHLDPRLEENGHLLHAHVLRRGDDRDARPYLVPDPGEPFSDLSRREHR